MKAFSGNTCNTGASGWTVVVDLRTWPLILACIFTCFLLRAQPTFGIETGISVLRYQDERQDDLPVVHPGHSYGFSLEFSSGELGILTGFIYERIAVVGVSGIGIFGIFDARDNYHRIRVPAAIAYPLWGSQKLQVSVLGGLHVDFVFAVDDNPPSLSLDRLNDVLVGGQGGIRVTTGRFYLASGYEYNFTRIVASREGSRAAGFFSTLGLRI